MADGNTIMGEEAHRRLPRIVPLLGFALLAIIAMASLVHLPGSLGTPPVERLRLVQASASSMEPLIRRGDRFLVDTTYYRSHPPSRGEVVLYVPPQGAGQESVKRVVAVGGDRVSVRNGIAIVNGALLDEPYADVGDPSASYNNTAATLVRQGRVFVLGDNRGNSEDSRTAAHGPVPLGNIVGLATRIVWSNDVRRIGTSINP